MSNVEPAGNELPNIASRITVQDRNALLQALQRDPFKPLYKKGSLSYIATLFLVLLWPFDMFYRPRVSAYPILFDLPLGYFSFHILYLRDIISNIILFLPLGFILTGWWQNRRRALPWLPHWISVTGSGFLLSTLLEAAQYWSPMRHSSLLDLAANTAGTLLGILLYKQFRAFLRRESQQIIQYGLSGDTEQT